MIACHLSDWVFIKSLLVFPALCLYFSCTDIFILKFCNSIPHKRQIISTKKKYWKMSMLKRHLVNDSNQLKKRKNKHNKDLSILTVSQVSRGKGEHDEMKKTNPAYHRLYLTKSTYLFLVYFLVYMSSISMHKMLLRTE